MTALLTDNLPLLAGAPNGIKKLRELILELAVRGKLVPQDPSDEPASELLKRIAEEKARLVAEGMIKKQKALPEVSEEERPFELPQGWMWCRLQDAFDVRDGTHDTPKYQLSGYPLVTSKNLHTGKLDLTDVKFISEEDHQKISARSKVDRGDILFAMIGSIGNPAIVDTDIPFSIKNVALLKQYSPALMSADYLLLYLLVAAADMREKSAGGVQSFVSLGSIRLYPFAFPPLSEQHRIVAKVDELMALCDRLEAQQADAECAHAQLVQALLDSLTQASDATEFTANWQRLAEHFHTLFTTEPSIDALKQTLLQLAVMGKLVPQDPSDEPVSELLKRVTEEKSRLVAGGALKKQKSLPEVSEEEKPYALPSNWKWVRFDSISNTRLGKMLDKAKNKGELRPYLRNTNVQWFNFEIDDLKSMRFEEHELDEYRVIPGDLVICEGGEPGRCAVWQGEVEDMFIQKALHRARPWLGISPFFLQFCLKAAAHSGFLDQFFTGATIKHFSGEKLAKYPVPLPPLAEQHRIVVKVDQLMALCDQLKTRLTQARQLNEQLASTLAEQAVA